MRIAAPTLAAISVTLFLIPSYLSFEPRSTSEVVSNKLGGLAIISLAGVTFAVWRAVRSGFATRTLRKQWLATSERINLPGSMVPTFRIPHRFPIIAVVGAVRPRLFIAEKVLRSLSAEELAAAIAHECGHLTARDNFKRTLLRACRDILLLAPFGRALDRAWAETAECAADEHAAEQGPKTALGLASALVKIAKMVPTGRHAAIPVAAFLVGANEIRGVKARVRRLLEMASTDYRRCSSNRARVKILPAFVVCSIAVFSIIAATNSFVLLTVHEFIERIVHVLS